MKSLAPILLIAFFCLPGLAGAEVYRWTDAQGKLHFGDKPPAGTAGVESFQGKAAVSFMGGGGEASAKTPSGKVRMFVTPSCTYCKKAKAYLRQRGTPFEELDVENSRSAKAEYDRLGGRGVPVILVGQKRMDGFDAGGLESLLVDAGL